VAVAEPVAGAEPAAVDLSDGISWQMMLQSGGKFVYILTALSVLALTFVIYFIAVLRVSQVAPRALYKELLEKIQGGAMEDAKRVCDYRPCPLSAVVGTALSHLASIPNADAGLIRDAVEAEGARQAEAIQGQTQYLMDVAVVAPMVGLLGTVWGMMRAFSAVALNIARARPAELATGVSQAMVTTAFGLIIAIPAMIFYAYFRRRASKLVAYLESASAEIFTAILSRRRPTAVE